MNLWVVILLALSTPNHGLSSPDNISSESENSLPPTLTLCKSSAALPDTIELPALTDIDGEVIYTPTPFRLQQDALECPFGTGQTSYLMESLSISEFSKLDDKTESHKYSLRANNTFVWDNGYLSLGTGHNSITYYSTKEYCIQEIRVDHNIMATLQMCAPPHERTFLRKCCLPWLILSREGSCISYSNADPLTHSYLDEATSEVVPYSKVNPSIRHELLSCGGEFWESDECDVHFYPTLTGKLAFLGANRRWEYFSGKYCIDQYLVGNSIRTAAYVCPSSAPEVKDAVVTSTVLMVSMYIGAFFHLLTANVYRRTWTSQSVLGRTTFCLMLSLGGMKILLGTAHLIGLKLAVAENGACKAIGIGGHFLMIAAFSWLLILNYEMWRKVWSSRSDVKYDSKRFVCYNGVGWGFPCVVLIISVILNSTFQCRSSGVVIPEYGQNFCFVAPWARGHYVYGILGILIGLAYALGLLTLKTIFQVKSTQRVEAYQKKASMFFLFFKFTLIMGLSWVFEFISWLVTDEEYDPHPAWTVLDVYNAALSAILIFVVCVCNRTTMTLLVDGGVEPGEAELK